MIKKKYKIGDTVLIVHDGSTYSNGLPTSILRGYDEMYVRRYKPINASILPNGDLLILSYYDTPQSLGGNKALKWKIRYVSKCGHYAIISSNENHALVIKTQALKCHEKVRKTNNHN